MTVRSPGKDPNWPINGSQCVSIHSRPGGTLFASITMTINGHLYWALMLRQKLLPELGLQEVHVDRTLKSPYYRKLFTKENIKRMLSELRASDFSSSRSVEEILYEAHSYGQRENVLSLARILQSEDDDLSYLQAIESAFKLLITDKEE